jgi:hypothetical protein
VVGGGVWSPGGVMGVLPGGGRTMAFALCCWIIIDCPRALMLYRTTYVFKVHYYCCSSRKSRLIARLSNLPCGLFGYAWWGIDLFSGVLLALLTSTRTQLSSLICAAAY